MIPVLKMWLAVLITKLGYNSPLLAAKESFEYNVLERTDYSGGE